MVLRVSFIFPHWSIFFGENLSGQPHVKRWCLRRKHSGFSGGSGVAFLRLNLEAMAHFCYYFDALALRVVVFHSHVQLPEGHICGIGASIASWFFIQGWRRKKGKQWTSEVHLGWHLETMIWQKRDAKDFFSGNSWDIMGEYLNGNHWDIMEIATSGVINRGVLENPPAIVRWLSQRRKPPWLGHGDSSA